MKKKPLIKTLVCVLCVVIIGYASWWLFTHVEVTFESDLPMEEQLKMQHGVQVIIVDGHKYLKRTEAVSYGGAGGLTHAADCPCFRKER